MTTGSGKLILQVRVVLLDEFIRRFNNDSSSEIRRYYLSHHRPFVKTREQLIRSLLMIRIRGGIRSSRMPLSGRVTDRENPDRLGFFTGSLVCGGEM